MHYGEAIEEPGAIDTSLPIRLAMPVDDGGSILSDDQGEGRRETGKVTIDLMREINDWDGKTPLYEFKITIGPNSVYRCELEYETIRKFCKTVKSTSSDAVLPKLWHRKRTLDPKIREKRSRQVAEWFKSIEGRSDVLLSGEFRQLCPFLPYDLLRDAIQPSSDVR